MQNKKKILEGIVVSDKMQKTVVVQVVRKIRHKKYSKLVEKRKKYYVHDETGKVKEGDKVKIMEYRPLSKLKRFRVIGS